MKRANGLWIADEILNRLELGAVDRILLAQITAFTAKGDKCYMTNETFARLAGESVRTVKRSLAGLVKAGLVEISGHTKKRVFNRVNLTQLNYTDSGQNDPNKISYSGQVDPNEGTIRANLSMIRAKSVSDSGQIGPHKIKNTKKHTTAPKIEFDFSSGQFTNIGPEQIDRWAKAYSKANIQAEIRKAAAWAAANPERAKKNWASFLVRWFGKAPEFNKSKSTEARKADPYAGYNAAAAGMISDEESAESARILFGGVK